MQESTSNVGSVVPREAVEGACSHCSERALQRYPVLSEGGWFMVVKCQHCLESESRERWNRLGYVSRDDEVVL